MDINSRNVNMLITGGSGSGKTVAACCTFARMTLKGGIPIKNGNSDVRLNLVADGSEASQVITDFMDLYRDMLINRLPNGTSRSKKYELMLKRNKKTICNIFWMDYRGALTRENWEDPAYKEQIQVFQEMLRSATLLTYIISGEIINKYIKSKKEDDPLKRELMELDVVEEASHIKTLMEKAEEIRGEEDKAPILFYITKSDYIECENDRKMFEHLISLLNENGLLDEKRKTIACHSTLGRELVLNEKNEIEGGFMPEGFEMPLMLAVGYAMSEDGRKWEEEENERIDQVIKVEELRKDIIIQEKGRMESGIFSVFGSIMKRRQKQIEKINEEIKEHQDNITEYKTKKAEIESELKSYSREILEYIVQSETDKRKYAIYVDGKGNEITLSKLFE